MTRWFNLCLKSSTPAMPIVRSSSPSLEGIIADDTLRSNGRDSPPGNLIHEYSHVVQTNSYSEIWSKIKSSDSSLQDFGSDQYIEEQLAQVLQPNKECVQEVLHRAMPGTRTGLMSEYFDHSENTSRLCLLLLHSVCQAHSLYAPLQELFDVLPSDSETLTQPQCDRAFDVFHQFDCLDNPFPCPDAQNFNSIRSRFSDLKKQLDFCLYKSRSKVRLVRRMRNGCAICLIGTTISVVVTTALVATHALAAFVAVPLLPRLLPSKTIKKELSHLAQLDVAAKGTYVLQNDLDTIDCLVTRLHTAVEGDKLLVRLGLERGREKHPIQQVVKHLHKNHHNFHHQLLDLEEHLCLCFAAINRARALLLQEVDHHLARRS